MTKIAAILISRQGLHPCQTTPWIVQLKKVFQWLQNNPFQLYTSLGQQTWELQIVLAQQAKIDQTIIVPTDDTQQFEKLRQTVMDQFCLDINQTLFEKLDPTNSKSLQYHRDKKIITKSDLLIPISIRKNGHMETLIHKKSSKKNLLNDFQIDYHPKKAQIAYTVDQHQLSQKLLALPAQYIIHWTRASNDPWPTENRYEYYQAILNSNEYPRSAFAGLGNILKHGEIKASSLHMPQKTATVSFSGLPPQKALSMMYWRARYRQMSFEPYGIGIEKDYAKSMGIQAVTYYQSTQRPDNMASWLCQSIGKRSDWRLEDEYRYLGDLNLVGIPTEKIVCFCFRTNEAIDIQKRFGVKSIAMING
jgi:hypothetical protein